MGNTMPFPTNDEIYDRINQLEIALQKSGKRTEWLIGQVQNPSLESVSHALNDLTRHLRRKWVNWADIIGPVELKEFQAAAREKAKALAADNLDRHLANEVQMMDEIDRLRTALNRYANGYTDFSWLDQLPEHSPLHPDNYKS